MVNQVNSAKAPLRPIVRIRIIMIWTFQKNGRANAILEALATLEISFDFFLVLTIKSSEWAKKVQDNLTNYFRR